MNYLMLKVFMLEISLPIYPSLSIESAKFVAKSIIYK